MFNVQGFECLRRLKDKARLSLHCLMAAPFECLRRF